MSVSSHIELTAENMKLNEVEPDGFTSEPRTISQEVAKMRLQVSALCDAVLQLVELHREANNKSEAALKEPSWPSAGTDKQQREGNNNGYFDCSGSGGNVAHQQATGVRTSEGSREPHSKHQESHVCAFPKKATLTGGLPGWQRGKSRESQSDH